ncbi:MAG: polymerase bacteriophage-type [Candidatus Peribacteria bacterium]|nr:polymerase bacteriophage-type [Candidatus Peribacteria bacterium]
MPITLDYLQARLKEWKGVELARTANPVLGEGNPHADIMFIGEAPGQKENEQGRPFVGAAGKLLNELLESIGLKRDDVYISNVVKYRPPQNRDPTDQEKQACLPWLLAEIALVQPRLIVPLGRHALGHFLPDITITNAHGKPQKLMNMDGVTVFPMYHPAAALYNGGLRESLFDDFTALRAFLDSQS